MPCNSSFGLSDPSFVILLGPYGERNATILDYNGTIQFSLFAINGAGKGNTTTFIFIPSKKSLIGWFKKIICGCTGLFYGMVCNLKYCIEQRCIFYYDLIS